MSQTSPNNKFLNPPTRFPVEDVHPCALDYNPLIHHRSLSTN